MTSPAPSTRSLRSRDRSQLKDLISALERESPPPRDIPSRRPIEKRKAKDSALITVANSPKRRKVVNSVEVGVNEDASGSNVCPQDVYCFECQDVSVEESLDCNLCPRSFHIDCAQHLFTQSGFIDAANECDEADKDCWVCPICQSIMRAECTETRSWAMQMLTPDRFARLLQFALNRMRHSEADAFLYPVSKQHCPDYYNIVFHPMDLSQLEHNVKRRLYSSTESFLADAKWIMHNCIIYNGHTSKYTQDAKLIIKIAKHEMTEVELCPDCYESSCFRNDSWFAQPCKSPHCLVWAKLRGFPYWPAKALRVMKGQVDVRFFGAHDRAWIPINQCYLLSEEPPQPLKHPKKWKDYDLALEELKEHQDQIREQFGFFQLAPMLTEFKADQLWNCADLFGPDLASKTGIKRCNDHIIPDHSSDMESNPDSINNESNNLLDSETATAMMTSSSAMLNNHGGGGSSDGGKGGGRGRRRRRRRQAAKSMSSSSSLYPADERNGGGGDSPDSGSSSHISGGVFTMNESVESECNQLPSELNIPEDAIYSLVGADGSGGDGGKNNDLMATPANSASAEHAATSTTNDAGDFEEGLTSLERIRRSLSGIESSESGGDGSSSTGAPEDHHHQQNDASQLHKEDGDSSVVVNDTAPTAVVDVATYSSAALTSPPPTPSDDGAVEEADDVMEHQQQSASAAAVEEVDGEEEVVEEDDEMIGEEEEEVDENEEEDVSLASLKSSNNKKDNNNSNDTAASDEQLRAAALQSIASVKYSSANEAAARKRNLHSWIQRLNTVQKATTTTLNASPAATSSPQSLKAPSQLITNTNKKQQQQQQKSPVVGHPPFSVQSSTSAAAARAMLSTAVAAAPSMGSSKVVDHHESAAAVAARPPPALSTRSSSTTAASNSAVMMIDASGSKNVGSSSKTNAYVTRHNQQQHQQQLHQSAAVDRHLDKITTVIKNEILELLQELPLAAVLPTPAAAAVASTESADVVALQAQIRELQDELKHMKWLHTQSINEIKCSTKLAVAEIQNQYEIDKRRTLEETKRKFLEEKEKIIHDTKTKQWCANCGKEAVFYCCWNTSYCDYPCQQAHWPRHQETCAQIRPQQQPSNSSAAEAAAAAVAAAAAAGSGGGGSSAASAVSASPLVAASLHSRPLVPNVAIAAAGTGHSQHSSPIGHPVDGSATILQSGSGGGGAPNAYLGGPGASRLPLYAAVSGGGGGDHPSLVGSSPFAAQKSVLLSSTTGIPPLAGSAGGTPIGTFLYGAPRPPMRKR